MEPRSSISSPPYRCTVLHIDDEPMFGEAVGRMLNNGEDIVCEYCRDPVGALEVAAALQPTVILLDRMMPEVDGMTLLKAFRRHPVFCEVPIIMLSTVEDPAAKVEAFALGASDYLLKFPNRVELAARVRYHSRAYLHLLQRNEAQKDLQAKKEELETELSKAADYVRSILPPPITEGDIRAEWLFVPSARLGGDSFGYHWLDDDHFAMYLLDVCDHGVGPALLSATVTNVLRAQTLPHTDFRDPAGVLRALNENFQMEEQNGLNFTIWYGVFSRKSRDMVYASGGHPPALAVRNISQHGSAAKIGSPSGSPNTTIGWMSDVDYQSAELRLDGPTCLYLFSDGAYDCPKENGEMWMVDDLASFLAGSKQEDNAELRLLHELLQHLNGGQRLEDDFTIVKFVFS